MSESVAVPKRLLKELYTGLAKVEGVLATLEELMDKEGLERVREAEQEYERGEYVTAQSSEEIEKIISEQ